LDGRGARRKAAWGEPTGRVPRGTRQGSMRPRLITAGRRVSRGIRTKWLGGMLRYYDREAAWNPRPVGCAAMARHIR
jgi:hypothetical protein